MQGQARLPLGTRDSPVRVRGGVLAPAHLIHLPADACWEASDDGPNEIPDSQLNSGCRGNMGVMQWVEDISLSLSIFQIDKIKLPLKNKFYFFNFRQFSAYCEAPLCMY